ncbi:hypothetical protein BGX38DRAFT_1161924 [Terfezia claveryi]|nr:hypothetical protein BGX38DRAFT_1161924 [Terfezia claveryi]
MYLVILAKCIPMETSTLYNLVMLTSRQDQPKTQYPPFQYDLPEDPPASRHVFFIFPPQPPYRPGIQRVSL